MSSASSLRRWRRPARGCGTGSRRGATATSPATPGSAARRGGDRAVDLRRRREVDLGGLLARWPGCTPGSDGRTSLDRARPRSSGRWWVRPAVTPSRHHGDGFDLDQQLGQRQRADLEQGRRGPVIAEEPRTGLRNDGTVADVGEVHRDLGDIGLGWRRPPRAPLRCTPGTARPGHQRRRLRPARRPSNDDLAGDVDRAGARGDRRPGERPEAGRTIDVVQRLITSSSFVGFVGNLKSFGELDDLGPGRLRHRQSVAAPDGFQIGLLLAREDGSGRRRERTRSAWISAPIARSGRSEIRPGERPPR